MILKYKRPVIPIRVRKVSATHHLDGVVTPLSHIPDIGNTHGKENIGFNPP